MCVSICFTISCHLSLFQLQFKFNYQNTYSRIIPNLETYIYEGKTFMILLQFDVFHSNHLWRQNWNSFFFLSWDKTLIFILLKTNLKFKKKHDPILYRFPELVSVSISQSRSPQFCCLLVHFPHRHLDWPFRGFLLFIILLESDSESVCCSVISNSLRPHGL